MDLSEKPDGFAARHAPPPLLPVRPRGTLEIIIDTCSNSPEQLAIIDRIVAHTMQAKPRIYQDYRIVIPVQIATETNRMVFPEFLSAELARPPSPKKIEPSNLRQFYTRHRDHIDIVETDISRAYKFFYAKQALALLADDPALRQRVVAKAQEFADIHGELSGDVAPSAEDFEQFCKRLESNLRTQEKNFSQTFDQLQQHHALYSKPDLQSALQEAEITSMARQSERLFKGMSGGERILLQAMYSEPELNSKVARQDSFKAFRMDKGERAIESYLFKERTNYDANTVSLVVSEDVGARDAINALRNSSKNTVLVVSKSGLQRAMHYLDQGVIPGPGALSTAEPTAPTCDPRKKWELHPENPRFEKITNGRSQQASTPTLHLPTEGEWARRLAELIEYGRWTPPKPAAARGLA